MRVKRDRSRSAIQARLKVSNDDAQTRVTCMQVPLQVDLDLISLAKRARKAANVKLLALKFNRYLAILALTCNRLKALAPTSSHSLTAPFELRIGQQCNRNIEVSRAKSARFLCR